MQSLSQQLAFSLRRKARHNYSNQAEDQQHACDVSDEHDGHAVNHIEGHLVPVQQHLIAGSVERRKQQTHDEQCFPFQVSQVVLDRTKVLEKFGCEQRSKRIGKRQFN